jgi:hypothetical protein
MEDAYPYLEKAIENGYKDIEAKRTLMNIYYTLDLTEKYKKMKAEVDKL